MNDNVRLKKKNKKNKTNKQDVEEICNLWILLCVSILHKAEVGIITNVGHVYAIKCLCSFVTRFSLLSSRAKSTK